MPALSQTMPINNIGTKNVLGSALKGGKALAEKRIQTLRRRNHRKAYVYLIFSLLVLALYSIYFLYPQTVAYLNAPESIRSFQEKVVEYDEVILPSLQEARDLHKAAYDAEFGSKEVIINRLLPTDLDREGITRRLENFATSLNAVNPPFELNAISFGDPIKEQNYRILPVSMSIHSSRANFDRFLQLINLSGKLETEDDIYIRLMEIANINVRYRGIDRRTGEDLGVDFSVKLNAYSR